MSLNNNNNNNNNNLSSDIIFAELLIGFDVITLPVDIRLRTKPKENVLLQIKCCS